MSGTDRQKKQGQRRRRGKGRGQGGGAARTVFRPYTPEELEARKNAIPHITYPDSLPVSARREEIARAISENQVTIIAGETGSGKTTQLPKICLELGLGLRAMIGHTQPRRIAARSVAERIASELGQELGKTVGYQVRFTEEVSRETRVKLMTDGILLAEIQGDPTLSRYDAIIIDEAHERSLNIDFLLGYLAQLLPSRPDLKVIITSATIDTQRFAEHFSPSPETSAPVIEVSGRTYPVEVRYRPLDEEYGETEGDAANPEQKRQARDQITGIIEAAEELMDEGPGDILVFLSGEGEIRDTQKAFEEELGKRYTAPGETNSTPGAVEVLPLFSRLSAAEQHRIFSPGKYRRIVLATNVAETSLTVPGIRYVIDPGTARISRYSNKTKVQRLPIEKISQASANQRSGRCGRVADGIAIRLYSEEDFSERPEFTQPEIQRTSLASVILHMLSLKLGKVADFPFIDPPEPRAVRAGQQLLEEIGAIRTARNGHNHLTRIGSQLAKLPIDPRLGRMLVEADANGCASEVLVLVAALSVQDVRERPAEFRAQADQLHARFNAASSDFLAYLTMWRYLRTQQRELSGSAFRRMCRAEFLNYLRFREWLDVARQLEQMARPLGLKIRPLALPSSKKIRDAAQDAPKTGGSAMSGAVAKACRDVGRSSDTPEAGSIHRSLLVGLLSNVGNFTERTRDYEGTRNTHFVIWPGSGLYRRSPDWVMAAELVETSRLFARTVAAIQPEWIEPLAKNLVRRTYTEPYWSSRNGAAMCKEKVTLYGLTLVADRPVLLARTGSDAARELARDMFIRHALVGGEWRSHHQFLEHNRQALAEAEETEHKLRVRGLVADEDTLATFYEERVPDHIVSGRHFDSWWKKQRRETPHLLDFTQEFLLGETEASEGDFPETWHQGDISLPISYSFAPGNYADGISVDIPISLLPQVRPEGFDWLVPGMREDLVVGTIRALPKRVRRELVPAPDVAKEILAVLPAGDPGEVSFVDAFSRAAQQVRGVEITAGDWKEADLPPHLQVNFVVRSERGAVLDESTSLAHLQLSLAPQSQKAVETVVETAVARALDEALSSPHMRLKPGTPTSPDIPVDGWPETDDGVISPVIHMEGPAGMDIRAYPALVERGGKVFLDVVTDPVDQVRQHALGVIQLLANTLALPEGRVTSRWSGEMSLILASTPYANTSALVADLQWAAARNLAYRWGEQNDCLPAELRSGREFEDEIYVIAQAVAQANSARGQLDAAIRAHSSVALVATVSDERAHMNRLMPSGFLRTTPHERLWDIPRYMQAGVKRIEKAVTNPAGDDALAWQLAGVEEKWAQAQKLAAYSSDNPDASRIVEDARWMIEELRVSFFAQQLGTKGKVSVKRIEKLLNPLLF